MIEELKFFGKIDPKNFGGGGGGGVGRVKWGSGW